MAFVSWFLCIIGLLGTLRRTVLKYILIKDGNKRSTSTEDRCVVKKGIPRQTQENYSSGDSLKGKVT
jgi:hypothetical protein